MERKQQNPFFADLERVPRGSAGSTQNQFRYALCHVRGHSTSIDECLEKALDLMKRDFPEFTPTILPRHN